MKINITGRHASLVRLCYPRYLGLGADHLSHTLRIHIDAQRPFYLIYYLPNYLATYMNIHTPQYQCSARLVMTT
jgi:hypothetical protein